jgi:hypothetical protein
MVWRAGRDVGRRGKEREGHGVFIGLEEVGMTSKHEKMGKIGIN